MANQPAAIDAAFAQSQRHFRQLRGFARPRLAAYHHHLVLAHQRHDLVTLGTDGQVIGEI